MNVKNDILISSSKLIRLKQVIEIYSSTVAEMVSKISSNLENQISSLFENNKYYKQFLKEFSYFNETQATMILNTSNYFTTLKSQTSNLKGNKLSHSEFLSPINQKYIMIQKKVSEHFFLLSKEIKELSYQMKLENLLSKINFLKGELDQGIAAYLKFTSGALNKFKGLESFCESLKKNYSNEKELTLLLKSDDIYEISINVVPYFNEFIDKSYGFAETVQSHIIKLNHISNSFLSTLNYKLVEYAQSLTKYFSIDFNSILKAKLPKKGSTPDSSQIIEHEVELKIDESKRIVEEDEVQIEKRVSQLDTLEFSEMGTFDFSFNAYEIGFDKLQSNLIKFKDLILNVNQEKLEFVTSFSDLFDYLKLSLPQRLSNSDFNIYLKSCELKVKRNQGVFQEWQDCEIIETIQGNLLVYCNSRSNLINLFNVSNTIFNKKSKELEFSLQKQNGGLINRLYSSVTEHFKCLTSEDFHSLSTRTTWAS